MRRKNEGRNKLAGVGMGFLLCFALDFILCGDVMGYTNRYQDYHKLILTSKNYPFDLLVRGNAGSIINTLNHWIKKNDLPFTVKKKFERIIINKKADADTPA